MGVELSGKDPGFRRSLLVRSMCAETCVGMYADVDMRTDMCVDMCVKT